MSQMRRQYLGELTLGGVVDVGPRRGGGTRVKCVCPVRRHDIDTVDRADAAV